MPKLISQMLPKIQKKTIYSYFLVIFYLNGHDLVPSKTFTWMLPAVGARSLRCFAIRSLGIRRCQPRNELPYKMPYPARDVRGRTRQLLHSVNGKEFFYMDAACGRRPLAQELRNSLPGHPPPSATKRRYHNKCHIQPEM